MRPSTSFAAALALACTLGGVAAQAQPGETEALHRRGLSLREEGRHDEARRVFEDLWLRTREPRALARLALAEAALRLWVQAEMHLASALQASDDPWIRENRERLEGNLRTQRENVGLVEVLCDTPGARVSLRGGEELPLPLRRPVRISTGELTIVVTAPGFQTQRRTVLARNLAEGLLVERFTLEPALPDEREVLENRARTMRYVSYGLFGLGGLFAALSTWQYLEAAGIASNSRDATADSPQPYRSWFIYYNLTTPQHTISAGEVCNRGRTDTVTPAANQVRELCGQLDSANAQAVGFLVTSVAALGAGAALFLLAPARPPRLTLSPWTGPRATGLTLAGTF